ncbi:MAG: ABC transporter ATP-binding protein [Clostridiales bacterium]|nr:ABC transporter ATP-binding protein [Clostridiales bacterium]MBS5877554.1 ABC transporter ATP-binding protein [Clostridiales bacterium]MDU0939755.1 ABC transporter ATP-binding protein [Clostridiales bacterium]MDU1042095.1 ABC transporter ATP-binding protein [Clostridiales bacterium]MDU3489856.1 ABC transporter ATP-binding protein [Clostridiales bacterium]
MRLECKNVVKRYYSVVALNNLNMLLESGKVYALIGPNGSGKSTIMKIMAGLSQPTSGDVTLDGENIGWRTKAKIAYMPTEPYFFTYMRCSDVAKYHQDFFGDFDIKRFEALMADMQVPLDRKMRELSSGMMAKLKIAITLSRNCPLILLDEPMNGIDMISRDHIMQAIIKNIRKDITIVISSHMVEELEKIVDSAIFMQNGATVLQGDVEELREKRGRSIADIYREIYG